MCSRYFALLTVVTATVLQTRGVAATFNIPNGDVAALKSAIAAANTNSQDDVINLAAGGLYTLATVDNVTSAPNGLPIVAADGGRTLTINGNNATIARGNASGTPAFRVLLESDTAAVI